MVHHRTIAANPLICMGTVRDILHQYGNWCGAAWLRLDPTHTRASDSLNHHNIAD